VRQGSTDKLLAEMALDIFSYDDVRTGNGRIAISFLDSSVVHLTEHSKIVIDDFVYDPDPKVVQPVLLQAGWLGLRKKTSLSVHPARPLAYEARTSLQR